MKTTKIKFSKYLSSSFVWGVDNKHDLPDILKEKADKEFYSKKELCEFWGIKKSYKIGKSFTINTNGTKYDIPSYEAEIEYSDKKILTILRVMSGFHSFSTSDVSLYKEEYSILGKYDSAEESDEMLIYYRKDETLYYKQLSDCKAKGKGFIHCAPTKEEVNKIVSYYEEKGFTRNKPQYYQDYITNKIEEQETKHYKFLVDNNYVLSKKYEELTTKDYLGGFSLETFFEEDLISYIERKCAFGYIGHVMGRKIEVDKIIEEEFRKVMSREQIAAWVTSGDGRHFGDFIAGNVERNEFDKIRDIVKHIAPSIYNKTLIWNSPEHKGTLDCTKKIRAKMEDMKMLMPENENLGYWY